MDKFVLLFEIRYTRFENHLILISNLEQHSVQNLDEVYERYCVTLDVSTADLYLGHTRKLNIQKNHPQGFSHVIDVTPFQDTVLRIFQNIVSYFVI